MDYASSILAFTGAALVITFAIVIAIYIVYSLAFFKALKKVDYRNPWLAWIPVAQHFALADAAFDDDKETSVIFFGKCTLPKMVVNFYWVITYVIAFIPVIGSIASLILNVLVLGAIFAKLFVKIEGGTYEEKRAVAYISAVIPLIAAIKFLMVKE